MTAPRVIEAVIERRAAQMSAEDRENLSFPPIEWAALDEHWRATYRASARKELEAANRVEIESASRWDDDDS